MQISNCHDHQEQFGIQFFYQGLVDRRAGNRTTNPRISGQPERLSGGQDFENVVWMEEPRTQPQLLTMIVKDASLSTNIKVTICDIKCVSLISEEFAICYTV